jgi:hypothetical protein
MKGGIMVVLTVDWCTAIAFWLMREYGLEVPPDWESPHMRLLPDTNDDQPAQWKRRYYTDGGSAWPARWIMEPKERP